MQKIITLLILLFYYLSDNADLFAQNYQKTGGELGRTIDSIKTLIVSANTDTLKMRLQIELGDCFENEKPDTAIFLFGQVKSSDTSSHTTKYFEALSLFKAGRLYQMVSDIPKAENLYNLAFVILEKIKNSSEKNIHIKSQILISKCLYNCGIIFFHSNRNKKAIDYLLQASKLFEETNYKLLLSNSFLTIGRANTNLNQSLKAIEYYQKSISIAEKDSDQITINWNLNNLGTEYKIIGDYSTALKYYSKALINSEKSGDKKTYSRCLLNIAAIYTDQGDFPKAFDYYQKALKIAIEINDLEQISNCQNNLGLLFYYQGNNKKATKYFLNSIHIAEEQKNYYLISLCLNNLGLVCQNQSDFSNAIEYHLKSLEISEREVNKEVSLLSLNNLGLIYFYQGKYDKAMEYYLLAIKIAEDIKAKEQLIYSFYNIGKLYFQMNDYEKSVEYIQKSIQLHDEMNYYHEITDLYLLLANIYIKQNKIQEAVSLYLKTNRINTKMLQENFSILNEKEKEDFLNQTSYQLNYFREFALKTNNDSVLKQCYTNELMLKGIILQSNRGIINVVEKTRDTALINTYRRFKMYHNKLTELYNTAIEDREIRVQTVDSLINEEDRKLVLLSKDFAVIKKKFNYKWKDVRDSLKKNEAAIEFVSFFNYSNTINSDTIWYCAIIIRPEYECPKMVKLFNNYEFEKVLIRSGTSFKDISKIYGNKFEKQADFYKLIWAPIDSLLNGIKKVYFAPAGILNKISFSAIKAPDGNYLSDKYNLNEVSSTANIINSSVIKIAAGITVDLYGGIDFNGKNTKEIVWKYLNGTATEIEKISKILNLKKVSYKLFTGKKATEENVKYNEGMKSPGIIHISTHGFFYPDPAISQNVDTTNTELNSRKNSVENDSIFGARNFMIQKNPMLRSGLVFAGANDVWNVENISGEEDGVLTAREVSNMNLNNTQLVVLSACETGLGDIKGSEGVYGLQRAFKMAGVKILIMSLWQVPDKETSEFMTKFYEKLLATKDIRKSFNETQSEMRKKYDPFYWGAFVLIE